MQSKALDARADDALSDEGAVELSAEDEAELAERLAAVRRGDVIEYSSVDDMLLDVCR